MGRSTMSIGLTRDEYDEQMQVFQIAIDGLVEIAETDLCHQTNGCHDIAYKTLKAIMWFTDIDPDKDIEWP